MAIWSRANEVPAAATDNNPGKDGPSDPSVEPQIKSLGINRAD